jgi:SAM-dependent methyltransferase
MPHEPGRPLPFAAEQFDAIWCCEYLDRVFDPAAVLSDMRRVLVPEGRLLLTVPDHGRVRNVLIALFNWDGHFAPTNPRIRYFTRTTLAKLVRDAGFGEISLQRAGALRRLAGRLVPRSLMLRARKGVGLRLTPAEARADRGTGHLPLEDNLAFAGRSRAA